MLLHSMAMVVHPPLSVSINLAFTIVVFVISHVHYADHSQSTFHLDISVIDDVRLLEGLEREVALIRVSLAGGHFLVDWGG